VESLSIDYDSLIWLVCHLQQVQDRGTTPARCPRGRPPPVKWSRTVHKLDHIAPSPVRTVTNLFTNTQGPSEKIDHVVLKTNRTYGLPWRTDPGTRHSCPGCETPLEVTTIILLTVISDTLIDF
jgi:hypothetical protein